MVIVVIMPSCLLTRNDAPMARPSVKLCVQSAARFKYAETLIPSPVINENKIVSAK